MTQGLSREYHLTQRRSAADRTRMQTSHARSDELDVFNVNRARWRCQPRNIVGERVSRRYELFHTHASPTLCAKPDERRWRRRSWSVCDAATPVSNFEAEPR